MFDNVVLVVAFGLVEGIYPVLDFEQVWDELHSWGLKLDCELALASQDKERVPTGLMVEIRDEASMSYINNGQRLRSYPAAGEN